MDISLDAEQQQFQESAARFFRERSSFDRWRHCVANGEAFDHENWSDMAKFGWLALNLSEADGGFGAKPAYTRLLMEQAGRALAREPLVGTGVIAPQLLPYLSEPLRGKLAAHIGAGEVVVALAHGEPNARFDLSYVETRAEVSVGGFTLYGIKSHVPDGAAADWFIVPARTGGTTREPLGISLFLIPATAQGLTRHSMRGADHRHHAQLQLSAVTVGAQALIGCAGRGHELLERVVDYAIVAGIAEAVGIMEALCDTTLDYLKTREQFGVRIGSFQTLQHRMVDMKIACEEARAMSQLAGTTLGEDARQRRRTVSAAKTRVGQASLFVGHQAVQLHGGIGTTDDLIVSHYLKRLVTIESSFGNADFHRQRFLETAPTSAAGASI